MISEKEKYHKLIENLPEAFAYHQMVMDNEGRPADYIFLDVNPAFETMTGLKRRQVINKRVTEANPDIKNSAFPWIFTYAKVAASGESISFVQFSKNNQKWYDVMVYSDQPGFFAVVFRDITEQKLMEARLRESERSYATLLFQLRVATVRACVSFMLLKAKPKIDY